MKRRLSLRTLVVLAVISSLLAVAYLLQALRESEAGGGMWWLIAACWMCVSLLWWIQAARSAIRSRNQRGFRKADRGEWVLSRGKGRYVGKVEGQRSARRPR